MKARAHLRPSKWSALRPAVRAVLGKSLPRRVEAFYARHDGLTVSLGSGSEKATLFGLAELFGGLKRGAFRPHLQVTKKTVADLAWSDQPFYEVFFDESDDDVSAKALASLNLRLRLKRLVSVAGESVDLAIDLTGKTERLYFVYRMHEAHELHGLDFDAFVHWFSRFGTARWYFAFLDAKSEAAMNIEVRAELERSLADFPADDWAPLLARLPKKRVPVLRAATVTKVAEPTQVSSLPAWGHPAFITPETPRALVFSGEDAVGVDGDYVLTVTRAGTEKPRWKSQQARSAAVSPDGAEVAVIELDRDHMPAALVIRSLATGKVRLKKKLQDHEVAWGPSGLFVGNHSGTLRRLDATTLEETFTATMPPFVRTMRAVSEGLVVSTEELDAGSMAVGGGSQAVHLLDATNGALRKSWDRGVRFAVSAGALAVTFGAEVKVFDLPSCAERWGVKAPEKDGFNHLTFSADGGELVCTHRFDDDWGRSPSHLLRIDAKTGASRGAWPMGQRPGDERFGQVVDALAISPGGALAVATSPVGLHWWRL